MPNIKIFWEPFNLLRNLVEILGLIAFKVLFSAFSAPSSSLLNLGSPPPAFCLTWIFLW